MKLNKLHDDYAFILQGIEDHFAELGYHVFLGDSYASISRTNDDVCIVVFISQPTRMTVRIYRRNSTSNEIEFDLNDPASIPGLERLVTQHLGIPETHP